MRSLLFLIISCCFNAAFAQHHLGNTYPNVLFANNVQLRQAPYDTSKVLAKLKHNSMLKRCAYQKHRADTLHGEPGSWQPVAYGELEGFVWHPLLADAQLNSIEYPGSSILLERERKEFLHFKVFKNDSFYEDYTFHHQDSNSIRGFFSLGKTWNSAGKEVIAVVYAYWNYVLFTWDGEQLEPTKLQLSDESRVANRYATFDKRAIVNAEGVHLRAEPNSQSGILAKLPKYSRLVVLKANHTYDRSKEPYHYWHRVAWADSHAYVFAPYLDIPKRCMNNNKHEGQQFLYTTNHFYVKENGKFIASCPTLVWLDDDDHLIDFGHKGFGQDTQFIAFCYSASSCGAMGGDRYYLWDAHTIKYFCNDYGIGDGGYSEGQNFTFPNEPGGKPGKLVMRNWYAQSSDIRSQSCSDYTSDLISSSTKILKFNGDTLEEIPTIHSRLRHLVESKFSDYRLQRYWFHNFNGDALNDAVFVLTPKHYDDPSPSLIGIAIATDGAHFREVSMNKHLLVKSHEPIVEVSWENEMLEITIAHYTDIYADDEKTPQKAIFAFQRSQNGQWIWHAKTTIKAYKNEDQRGWYWGEPTKQYYKSNTIYFQNSWY